MKKNYELPQSFFIDSYALQYVFDQSTNIQFGEQWKDRWIFSDMIVRMINTTLTQSPLILPIEMSSRFTNLIYKNKIFFNNGIYDPKETNLGAIGRLANRENKTVLLPMFSILGFSSDKQYYNNSIRYPNTEYNFTYYLHLLLIQNREIIYHQARAYKSVSTDPDNHTIYQSIISDLVKDAIEPYIKRLKREASRKIIKQ